MELIINTFGVSLNRDNEGFVVTKGAERQRIPVDSVSSIQISKGASITSDAIMLAIEKEIVPRVSKLNGGSVTRKIIFNIFI